MDKEILNSVDALKEGKTLLYPSDTLWALGCDATNENAVNRLEKIKPRSKDGSIILVCDDRMLQNHVKNVPDIAWTLIDTAVDPLTIIYDEGISLVKNVRGQDGSIAIRMVKEGFIFEVLRKFRKPIVSTSANFTGEKAPQNFSEINKDLMIKLDVIVNLPSYKSKRSKASSIIKLSGNSDVRIIRR